MEHQLFAAEPSPPEIPADFGKTPAAATGSYAQFAKAPSLDATGKPITVEAWFTATNPNGAIVARGGPAEGFALTLEGGLPTFHVRSNSTLSSVTGQRRVLGGWHHIAGVLHANKEMHLYVDGEKVASGQASGLLTKDPVQGIEIGADAGSAVGNYESPFGFTGVIDEVRLYFAESTAEQIAQRFKSDAEIHNEPRLVISFDDGTARDMSSFRNNGTLEGGVPIDGHTGKAIRFSNNAARLDVGNAKRPAARCNRPNAGRRAAAAAANAAGSNKAQTGAATGNAAGNAAAKKPPTNNSLIKPKWTADIPVYARAMVLAGDELFIAGPLDMIDEEETFQKLTEKDAEVHQLLTAQDDALNGGIGGLLLSVNAASGEVDQKLELGTLPTWDGMAGARGKLFLTTVDGQVMCYGK